MSTPGRRIASLLQPAAGFTASSVALKVAEILEIHGQLRQAIAGLPPAAFEWQSAPGANTIGMLLTHIALAEVNLTQVILKAEPKGHVSDVLGIDVDDDGMPMAQFGPAPPAALAGKTEAFFLGLFAAAEAHTLDACRPLDEASLGAEIVRPPRPDGSYRVFDRRWTLHHLVEHAAQHLGQIQVLKGCWQASGR